MHGRSHRYGAPRWYHASRRAALLRLAIPAALAIVVAGFAIGAGVAYFSDHGGGARGTARTRPTHAAPSETRHAHAPRPGGAQSGAGASSATTHPAPAPASASVGHRLNDEGYALVRAGDAAAAITPLRQAVNDLAGAGPADPYEAYANYNLG